MPRFPQILVQVFIGGAVGFALAMVLGWLFDVTGVTVAMGGIGAEVLRFTAILLVVAISVWAFERRGKG